MHAARAAANYAREAASFACKLAQDVHKVPHCNTTLDTIANHLCGRRVAHAAGIADAAIEIVVLHILYIILHFQEAGPFWRPTCILKSNGLKRECYSLISFRSNITIPALIGLKSVHKDH